MPRFSLSCLLSCFFSWLCLSPVCAQDTTLVLDTAQLINLSRLDGWVYAPGHNPDWAKPTVNSGNWRRFKPADLSIKDADKNGKVEGWFRLNIRLDSTWEGMDLGVRNGTWAATDVYIDGQWVASFGNTGINGKPYQDHHYLDKLPKAIRLTTGQAHLLAIHLVDYVSPFLHYPSRKLQLEVFSNPAQIVQLTGPRYPSILQDDLKEDVGYKSLWFGSWLLMTICFWLLSWLKFSEKHSLQLLAIGGTFASLSSLARLLQFGNPSFAVLFGEACIVGLSLWLTTIFILLTIMTIFGYQPNRRWSTLLIITAIAGAALDAYVGNDTIISIANFMQQITIIYLLITSWKRLQGAQWAIVIGTLVSVLAATAYAIFAFANVLFNSNLVYSTFHIVYSVVSLGFPFGFLVYIALRFREILAEIRAKAVAVVQITEEKRAILAAQNQLLEQQVEARTAELKASQVQLIQKEKLASLGELTAGIAHEIQNPLNFVNNFSEVSTELVDELKEGPFQQLPDSEREYAEEILGDLTSNLKKINHHGERASSIVKGMLEHSRTESGEKRPTNLNALADEYLKIAYHGFRAKDKTGFNCQLVTDFDSTLALIDVAPQEIGRVLLNLYNNAFYAMSEHQQAGVAGFQPILSLTTRLTPHPDSSDRPEGGLLRVETVPPSGRSDESGWGVNQVEIQVSDNGTGIPESVKAKIFQPFFTTKPTGEGTGLGLSLSYDIITKGHGGVLAVESTPMQGSTFTICLPLISLKTTANQLIA
ncbi:ATP-binding protein [Spirosoma arboris]|uniref:ATP-binding protein n=1 Tax=Spirosoma arboris TaxID=2682092 RepID=UPI001D0FA048|nr:ATP-binding protein [Spirosoma arboris]